jgi:hypothetical protein
MPRAREWEEDTNTNKIRKKRKIRQKRKPTSRHTKRRSSAYLYPTRSPILGKACGRPPQEAARYAKPRERCRLIALLSVIRWFALSAEKRTLRDHRNSVGRDHERYFTTSNCRTAKGSFDRLVGDGEQRRRHLDAQRLGSLEVNDQLELSRLHDWQVGRPLSLKNPACVDAYLAICIGKSGSIADQSAGCGKFDGSY